MYQVVKNIAFPNQALHIENQIHYVMITNKNEELCKSQILTYFRNKTNKSFGFPQTAS